MRRIVGSSLLLASCVALAGCGASVEPAPPVTEDLKAANEQELKEVEMQEKLQQRKDEAAARARKN